MKIGVDLDGTSSNTIEVVYSSLFKKVDPGLLPVYDLSSYGADHNYFNQEWVYGKARPYKRAAQVLRALLAQNELIYITARPSSMREVTEAWLVKYGFPFAELVMGRVKSQVIRDKGIQLMIEDNPSEIEHFGNDVSVILMDRPYNRHLRNRRASSWTEVLSMVEAAV